MRKKFMQFASLLTSGSRGRHIMVKRVSLGILLAGVLSATAGVAQAGPPTGVSCGELITAPGQYYLTADCTGSGISIIASNVHLKLMGHTMTGIPFLTTGLFVANVSHVHIEGPGMITRHNRGIEFIGVSDSHIEQVSSTANTTQGLLLRGSTDTHVNNNVISANTDDGIAVIDQSIDNHLNNNQAIGNTGDGIYVAAGSTGNHVNGNTALGNGAFDLEDLNPNCDNNKWNGNTFNTSNPANCIH